MIEDDLEPLITQCPNCSTRFRVTESQLQVAAGRVRCGACLTVFQGIDFLLLDENSTFTTEGEAEHALDALLDELEDEDGSGKDPGSQDAGPLDPAAAATIPESIIEEPEPLTVSVEPRQLYGGFEEDADQEIEDGDQEIEDADQEIEDGDQPSEAQTSDSEFEWASMIADKTDDVPALASAQIADQPISEIGEAAAPREISFAPEPRRWWAGLVMGLFVLALAGQVFVYQLPSWGKDPDLRWLYESGCEVLGCELPIMQDLDLMQASSLVVRSHPELVGALVVDAVIINQAPYNQPFPDLELRFSAVGGALVAGRRFTPSEYLAGEMMNADQVPPMTPIQVSLEIEDPGEDAVNYTLTFR